MHPGSTWSLTRRLSSHEVLCLPRVGFTSSTHISRGPGIVWYLLAPCSNPAVLAKRLRAGKQPGAIQLLGVLENRSCSRRNLTQVQDRFASARSVASLRFLQASYREVSPSDAPARLCIFFRRCCLLPSNASHLLVDQVVSTGPVSPTPCWEEEEGSERRCSGEKGSLPAANGCAQGQAERCCSLGVAAWGCNLGVCTDGKS